MRKEFSNTIEQLAVDDKKIIFVTGDLGYNALENLQEKLGDRFINAGVAEQNMVGMAAGLAYKGYKVFCYSIAPFIVYRCLEQFRNDVCFHNLPVFLVGNGGGYGYGIMGSSHHALEDIACLSGLPNATCYVPAFSEDVESSVKNILQNNSPAYLRLGLGKPSTKENKLISSDFNQVISSDKCDVMIFALGPITHNVLDAISQTKSENINLYTCTRSPFTLPETITKNINANTKILVVEEHIATGGLGSQLANQLLSAGIKSHSFTHLFAKGYPTGTYGSQDFHQKQSGIDSENIATIIKGL